jgi:hypothetical protein
MTKKKVALADVLWDAANEHLDTPVTDPATPCRWSCNAVLSVEFGTVFLAAYMNDTTLALRTESQALRLLQTLGVDPNVAHHFGAGEDAQGVRYMWLLLAMHVAEDEGIEIEVDK